MRPGIDRTDSRGTRVLRAVATVLAAFAGVVAALIYQDLAMTGFPDGHITDYDRASRLPWVICAWTSVAAVVWFLFLGGFALSAGLRKRVWWSALLYLGLVAAAHYAIPYYFLDYLGLDHGQGG